MIPRPVLPEGPPRPPSPRPPSAPPAHRRTLFDLDVPLEQALVVAVPVPYQGTVSSAAGTVDGPAATIAASVQIDLFDVAFGEPWRAGIASLPELEEIRRLSETAERAARAHRAGEAGGGAVDAAGDELAAWVEDVVGGLWDRGRRPLLLGGEHGASLGAFRAAAARAPGLGLLQVDAHADLREAYEGFRSSHASVMARALELGGVGKLVQVGLRDVSPEDRERARREPERVVWHADDVLARRRLSGESFPELAAEVLAGLPQRIWISLDIDGLEPSLCPGAGTPVPGGLDWHELGCLLEQVRDSGREVVGADLVEIGPGEWDGYVAAKLAYRLAALLAGSTRP